MTDTDKKVGQFISSLEKEFRDIPEAIIREGAQGVLDYLKGRKTLAQMFNITSEMQHFMVEQGFNQFKTGRYEDAGRIFKVLTFLDWNNAYLHSMHGSCLQQQKKYGPAIAEFTEAIRLNPKDIVSLVNRAEIFLIHGQIPFARHDLEEALRCTDTGEPKWLQRAKTMKERIDKAFQSGKKANRGKGKKGAK